MRKMRLRSKMKRRCKPLKPQRSLRADNGRFEFLCAFNLSVLSGLSGYFLRREADINR
jgi:hypothetical protein